MRGPVTLFKDKQKHPSSLARLAEISGIGGNAFKRIRCCVQISAESGGNQDHMTDTFII